MKCLFDWLFFDSIAQMSANDKLTRAAKADIIETSADAGKEGAI
jgi:hypothetical protein